MKLSVDRRGAPTQVLNMKKRMQGMSLIAADMKFLGGIVKGSNAFDLATVQARAASLEQHARDTVRLFEPEAGDPKSEASATIWQDWNGFTLKAAEMQNAAKQLGLVATQGDLETAFRAMGQTCTACHKAYRINTN